MARKLGPTGRRGRYVATHRRGAFVVWALIAVGLGLLAPRVETALSGAGWEASGSESVWVRDQLQRELGGAGSYALQVAVHSSEDGANALQLQRTVTAVERALAADPAVGAVIPPHPAPRSPPMARPR